MGGKKTMSKNVTRFFGMIDSDCLVKWCSPKKLDMATQPNPINQELTMIELTQEGC
jgi:hypothetical protein